MTILERNRYLTYAVPYALALIQHLNEKRVAIGEYAIQFNILEHFASIAAKASGAVVSRQA